MTSALDHHTTPNGVYVHKNPSGMLSIGLCGQWTTYTVVTPEQAREKALDLIAAADAALADE